MKFTRIWPEFIPLIFTNNLILTPDITTENRALPLEDQIIDQSEYIYLERDIKEEEIIREEKKNLKIRN